MFSMFRIVRPTRVGGLHQGRAQVFAENGFDLLCGGVDDGLVGFDTGESEHGFADDADAQTLQRARGARTDGAGRVGLVEICVAPNGAEDVARIVVAAAGSLNASRTFAASLSVRHWIPVRSLCMSLPMAPPKYEIRPFAGRIIASALWLAGPRHEAFVSSQRLHITRLALTDTAEPELDPMAAARLVSNGLTAVSAPGTALVAGGCRQDLHRSVDATGVAGTSVVLIRNRLGIDNRSLVAQLLRSTCDRARGKSMS